MVTRARGHVLGSQLARVPHIPPSAERRIRREGRHAARRELALKLRREGKTLAAIGAVIGVSTTRALQMVRRAERLSTNSFRRGGEASRRRKHLGRSDELTSSQRGTARRRDGDLQMERW